MPGRPLPNLASLHFKRVSRDGGVSFLPHSEHSYKQAPYQPITKEQYEEAVAKMPKIDWSGFTEMDDNTVASQNFACEGATCEVTFNMP